MHSRAPIDATTIITGKNGVYCFWIYKMIDFFKDH